MLDRSGITAIVNAPCRKQTRPRNPNELAHRIFLESIGELPKTEAPPEKNPAAVALGRLGGLNGGAARAATRLQMHLDTCCRLLRGGQLPGRKIGARRWRVSASALKAYVEGGKPEPAKGE